MKYSIIIPCFNESASLPLLMERCKLITKNNDVEVIFVNNGSTDNTNEILKDLIPKYPNCKSIYVKNNKGYGFGILSGLRVAKGNVIGWTHADLQADPVDFLQGFKLFELYGNDIFVKGRRYGRPFIDKVFTFGMSIFESVLLLKPMWDINAQPTLFNRNFFESWELPPEDFSLDLYAYYSALNQDIKIYRFPVKFGQREHGISHWNTSWSAKWRFIIKTIKYSIKLKKII